MRYLLKFTIPHEHGNKVLADPEFGHKFQQLLQEIKAETAYLTALDGKRGGYIVVNMDDASQIPVIGEPFFFWLHADVELIPVMLPEDLGKAGPDIGNIIKKWG